MEIIIGIVTAVFIILIAVIVRQAAKIGILESSLKNEDKKIDTLRTEMENIYKEKNNVISECNQEITSLKNRLENNERPKRPLNIPNYGQRK